MESKGNHRSSNPNTKVVKLKASAGRANPNLVFDPKIKYQQERGMLAEIRTKQNVCRSGRVMITPLFHLLFDTFLTFLSSP